MNSAIEPQRLEKTLEEHLRREAPGLLALLNAASQARFGAPYPRLLAEGRLEEALAVIDSLYCGTSARRTAIHSLVAAPLAKALGLGDRAAEAITEALLRGDTDEARRLAGLAAPTGPPSRELARLLACALALEEAAAEAYEALAATAAGPLEEAALRLIAGESRLHAHLVQAIAEEAGLQPPTDTQEALRACRDPQVEAYTRYAKELAANPPKAPAERAAALHRLAGLERLAGEERYNQLLLPPLANTLPPRARSLAKKLIEAVIKDEQCHQEIAQTLAETTTQATQEREKPLTTPPPRRDKASPTAKP